MRVLRLVIGVKPLIALHHATLPLVRFALLHYEELTALRSQAVQLLLTGLIEVLRTRQEVILVLDRSELNLHNWLLSLILEGKGDGGVGGPI